MYKHINELPVEIKEVFTTDGQKRFKSVYNRESAKEQSETVAFLKAYNEAIKHDTGKAIDLNQYDESDGLIEGLGIPYGGRLQFEQQDGSVAGRDFDGEYFDEKTDYTSEFYDGKALVKAMPIHYDHCLDDTIGDDVIGEVKSITDTDKGKWFKLQLDKAHEYYKYLLYLAKCGALSLSTGAKNAQKAVDGHIDKWELMEISLTPSACNPMAQIAIKSIKSLGDVRMEKEEIIADASEEVKEPIEEEKADDAVEEAEATEEIAVEAIDEKSEEEKEEEKACDGRKDVDAWAVLKEIFNALASVMTDAPVNVEEEKAEDDDESVEQLSDNAEHDVDEALDDERHGNADEAEHDEVDADEEIEKLRDEIDEIKEELALEAEKKKSVEMENLELKKELEECKSRLDVIENNMKKSAPVLRSVANPKIGEIESQKSYDELLSRKDISPAVKAELSRTFVSQDIANVMGLK